MSGEWIPVTERLPPDGVEVLVCGQSGAVDIGRHCDGRWIGHGQDFLAVYERVTHWMRLPEPPTKSHQHTSEDVVQRMAETDASLRDELSATNCGDRQSITLTDAEREAVERAIASFDSSDYPASNADADTLRRLLFRCAKDCEVRLGMIDDCRRRREALERLSQTPDDIQQAGLRLTDKELKAVRMGAGALLESFVLHGRHGDRLASATLRGLLERHK